MIRVSRILCPVDFSEGSRRALEYAVALARWYGARVTALHVFPNVPVPEPVEEFALAGQALSLRDVGAGGLQTDLEHFVSSVAGDVPVETSLDESPDVVQDILAQAAVAPVDLVVMGTHGRRGVSRLVLGSVAERTMRRSTCPLLLVPPHARPAAVERIPFKRILAAIDFSTCAERAFAFALLLAEEADADITLLHVIDTPPELHEAWAADGREEIDVAAARARADAAALQRLRALVPDTVRPYCHVTTRVEEGSAARQILRVAGEERPDVIVMGVHGRGAVDLFVFGSTTHDVVLGADCPVLTVRA